MDSRARDQAGTSGTRFWRRLSVAQTGRPGLFVAIFAALALLGGWRATRLRLVTDFADLLPRDQPSVIELHNIVARLRGVSTVTVVLEGNADHLPALRRFADDLCPKLKALGSPYVESARSGVQEARRFLMPRAGLFLSPEDIDDLDQRLAAQEQAAFRRGIGADLDDREPRPPPLDASAVEHRLSERVGAFAHYPDGYYQAATEGGGIALAVVVKSAVVAGDLTGAQATLDRIQQTVTAALAGADAGPVRVGYAGDLVTGLEEYTLVRSDVLRVGGLGLAMILGVLLLFFRTPRALLALGATIGVGCALTFGLTQLAIGHLNVATAFLFSVVAGNGINFGIIWLSRFLEERRSGLGLQPAVENALARTYGATLAAACAAAAAYAALGIARFRGFRHFAFIGASGMLLCWVTSYALLPAVVALLARVGRHRHGPPRTGAHFERPFVWLVARAPRATLAAGMLVSVIALVAATRYLVRGPLEYDMRHMTSDARTTGELYRVSSVSSRVLGGEGAGPMAVLTDDPRDTPLLAAALRQVRDRAPTNLRPFQDVRTLDDFVPPDQPSRLEKLRPLVRRLQRDHDRDAVDEATWTQLAPLLPPPDLRPFGAADLPAQITEPFTERDGTRGRILYIQPTAGQRDSDLHYLLRWADAFRETRLPNGHVIHGSGRAVIFADLLRASLVDMPRSVVLSFLMTALMIVALFREARASGAVLGSLTQAVIWMLGALGLAGVRLSFINFIALPITFGIGVDYAVNIYGRYHQERGGRILDAVRGAGGAVILCSLTTSLGYVALLRAHNQAVRSLGAVAVLGEMSCLTTALLVLPAALSWRRSSRAKIAPAPEAAQPKSAPAPEMFP